MFPLPEEGVSVKLDGGSHEIKEIPMINNQIFSVPIVQHVNIWYKPLVNVKSKKKKNTFSPGLQLEQITLGCPFVYLYQPQPLFALSDWFHVNQGAWFRHPRQQA